MFMRLVIRTNYRLSVHLANVLDADLNIATLDLIAKTT